MPQDLSPGILAGTTSPLAPEQSTPKAVLYLLLAVTLFSALDTTAKYLSTRLGVPVSQIVWLRFAGQTLYMLAIYWLWNLPRLLEAQRPGLQMVRSFLMAATTICNFFALQTLRLDQTITIVFLAPLVVAALAGPLLGEWVGWRRGVAIAVGFCGVLIALHPGTTPMSAAVVVSLTGMLAYALFMLLTRHLTSYDPPFVMLFYSMIVGTVLGAPVALKDWVTPEAPLAWLLLALLGVLGGLGHWMFILAYQRAPASTVSPFLYAQLITMVSFGWLVFGHVPDVWTMLGASIIIASGIYLVRRERKVRLKDL